MIVSSGTGSRVMRSGSTSPSSALVTWETVRSGEDVMTVSRPEYRVLVQQHHHRGQGVVRRGHLVPVALSSPGSADSR